MSQCNPAKIREGGNILIEHIVLFKVKSGTPSEESDRMLEALRSLAGRVPAIHELTCGTNTSNRNQGFTHGLLVRVPSQNALEVYINHPEHQRIVAEYVRPIVETVIVVDYEF